MQNENVSLTDEPDEVMATNAINTWKNKPLLKLSSLFSCLKDMQGGKKKLSMRVQGSRAGAEMTTQLCPRVYQRASSSISLSFQSFSLSHVLFFSVISLRCHC